MALTNFTTKVPPSLCTSNWTEKYAARCDDLGKRQQNQSHSLARRNTNDRFQKAQQSSFFDDADLDHIYTSPSVLASILSNVDHPPLTEGFDKFTRAQARAVIRFRPNSPTDAESTITSTM